MSCSIGQLATAALLIPVAWVVIADVYLQIKQKTRRGDALCKIRQTKVKLKHVRRISRIAKIATVHATYA